MSSDKNHRVRVAIAGFLRGKALIVPGLVFKLLLWLGRLSPRFVLRLVYSWMGAYLRKKTPAQLPPAAADSDSESESKQP